MHIWPVQQKKHTNSYLVEEGQFQKLFKFPWEPCKQISHI